MAAALLTAIVASVGGIAFAIYLGLFGRGPNVLSLHISIGIFSTMICLFSHSMLMFYFLGKGKAVREAAAEGGLSNEFENRIKRARKPVFSIGTYAMLLTIVTGLMGASVDTGVLPPMIHAMIAYGAIASNVAAIKLEIDALSASARVVDEVNRLIGS